MQVHLQKYHFTREKASNRIFFQEHRCDKNLETEKVLFRSEPDPDYNILSKAGLVQKYIF